MSNVKIYFSDFFDVNEDIIESYGAVNISLINDLPLFIDPFLLFNSKKEEYQEIHHNIIRYLLFLKARAESYPTSNSGILNAWFRFSEVKQTWLGFCLTGNSGRGLGDKFAKDLHLGLQTLFKDFGNETMLKSPHLEKLCLISDLVGRDKISDLTTNFAKKFLLEYTSTFATENVDSELCKEFIIERVYFDYNCEKWMNANYVLPAFAEDYVLLTPKDILTRDETFINKKDMLNRLEMIAPSVEDSTLRFELNNYFMNVINKKEKEMSKSSKEAAAMELFIKHPILIDHYLKYKEDNEELATSISSEFVRQVEQLFNKQLSELVAILDNKTDFYKTEPDSYTAAYNRIIFLKNVIEDMDGYRIFYVKGKPISREQDLHVMYRLVWFASDYDVNREVNNGRGPVDYKVSYGSKDSVLVEFKLAKNRNLKNNLAKQVEIYQAASQTDRAIKVILFFDDAELATVNNILNELKLHNCKDIVLIDARNNKVSASKAKVER